MAPKNRNRNSQTRQSAQYLPSDYDTDTAYATDAVASMSTPAPIPPRTNEELNLSVLQRHDPSVHQILSVAPFAVVYTFNAVNASWEKQGTEGTLFVCALLPPVGGPQIERYSVTVLNRRGLENFSTELFSSSDVEVTDDYVILQVEAEDGNTDIFGLWIFAEEGGSTAQTRVVNALIIQECAKRAEDSRDAAAVADVEEEYVEEELPQTHLPPPQQLHQHQQQQHTQPQAHAPIHHEQQPMQQQSQQVSLLGLFKGGQQQGPSLASPFPSQTQHQYFPSQIQHQQHLAMPQQHYAPPSAPPGFAHPQAHPQMHQQAHPQAHQQAQADVLTNLFLNARRGY